MQWSQLRLQNSFFLGSIVLIGFLSQAAEETGRKMKVYAVEKNPNAVVTLDVSCQQLSQLKHC